MSTRTAAAALLALVLTAAALAPRSTTQAQGVMPALASANAAALDHAEDAQDARDPLAEDMRDGRWTRGFMRHRIVHFTFDDGPRPSTTRRLLEQLDAYDIKATFFVVGRNLEGSRHAEQRALLREMAARGHTIGSHTYDHARLTSLTEEQVEQEIDRSEQLIEAVFGRRPWLFRPPYGAHDRQIDELLAERGYTEMLWNISSMDTVTRDPDAMMDSFRAQLDRQDRHPRGPGGIILVHDTHEHSVDAFPRMVEELRSRNCEILDAGSDEELWDIANDPRIFFQARGEGRNRMAQSVELDDETLATRQAAARAQAEVYCANR